MTAVVTNGSKGVRERESRDLPPGLCPDDKEMIIPPTGAGWGLGER